MINSLYFYSLFDKVFLVFPYSVNRKLDFSVIITIFLEKFSNFHIVDQIKNIRSEEIKQFFFREILCPPSSIFVFIMRDIGRVIKVLIFESIGCDTHQRSWMKFLILKSSFGCYILINILVDAESCLICEQ